MLNCKAFKFRSAGVAKVVWSNLISHQSKTKSDCHLDIHTYIDEDGQILSKIRSKISDFLDFINKSTHNNTILLARGSKA